MLIPNKTYFNFKLQDFGVITSCVLFQIMFLFSTVMFFLKIEEIFEFKFPTVPPKGTFPPLGFTILFVPKLELNLNLHGKHSFPPPATIHYSQSSPPSFLRANFYDFPVLFPPSGSTIRPRCRRRPRANSRTTTWPR